MKLTQKAIQLLTGSAQLRRQLGLALNFTETWINVLIEKNAVNGKLTTATAIQVLREHGGLLDGEILEKCDSLAA